MALGRAQLPQAPNLYMSGYVPGGDDTTLLERALAQAATAAIGQAITNAFTQDYTNQAVQAGIAPEGTQERSGFFSRFQDPLTFDEFQSLQDEQRRREVQAREFESQGLQDEYTQARTDEIRSEIARNQAAEQEFQRRMAEMTGAVEGESEQESEGPGFMSQAGNLIRNNPVTNWIMGPSSPDISPEEAQQQLEQQTGEPRTEEQANLPPRTLGQAVFPEGTMRTPFGQIDLPTLQQIGQQVQQVLPTVGMGTVGAPPVLQQDPETQTNPVEDFIADQAANYLMKQLGLSR